MEIVDMPIEQIKPYKKNPRKNEKAIPEVVKSLKEFGFRQPLVVDSNMVLIVGHTRLLAAKELGLAKVPVHIASTLTPAQVRAYRITDNRSHDKSEWSIPELSEELDALFEMDEKFDLDFMDFSLDELDRDKEEREEGLTDPDEVPEDAEPRVRLGEVWRLGEHRLICGDSTLQENVSKLFGENTAELCFTSPPYSDQRDYSGDIDLAVSKIVKFISASNDHVKLYAVNLGLSRKNYQIVQYWDAYIKEAKDSGLKLLSWNVWDKKEATSVSSQTAMFAISHEWILVFGEERVELNKTKVNKHYGTNAASTVRQKNGTMELRNPCLVKKYGRLLTVTSIPPEKTNRDISHPAKFPVSLPEEYILACTDQGDIVYEPFLGSGTTLIACEATGRACFGLEIDPNYCDVIIERWEKFTGETASLLS